MTGLKGRYPGLIVVGGVERGGQSRTYGRSGTAPDTYAANRLSGFTGSPFGL
jgi:hypothetical protein